MGENNPMTVTSANTSINKTRAPAIVKLVEKIDGFQPGQTVLDWGCGKYPEVTEKALEKHRLNYAGYDPYNRTRDENLNCWASFYKADVVLMSNVLNVIPKVAIQTLTVLQAHKALKMGGKLYTTVYEGDKSGQGRETKPGCWQENKKTSEYVTLLKKIFGQMAVQRKGKLIIVKKVEEI
jgi:hypothetical protein